MEGRDGLLQDGRRDRAMGYGEIAMRGRFAIAKCGLRMPGDVETNAVAIGPWIGGKNADLGRHGNMRSLERFDKDGAFHRELRGVVRMLVVAATAAAVVF